MAGCMCNQCRGREVYQGNEEKLKELLVLQANKTFQSLQEELKIRQKNYIAKAANSISPNECQMWLNRASGLREARKAIDSMILREKTLEQQKQESEKE